MKKIDFKRLLLGTLMALQITNTIGTSGITTAYAKEVPSKEILMDDAGKELHMIGIVIDDYESITLGYIYSKDDCVYVKDAIDGRIYNFTKISEHLNYQAYPEIVFTEAENVLPDDLKKAPSLTKDEAKDLVSRFSITDKSYDMTGILGQDYVYTYQTFSAPGFDNEDLHIANSSKFDDADDVFYSFTVSDDYNPDEEIIDYSANNFKLGIYDTATTHPVYSNIYQKDAIGTSDKMGVIIRFYIFDQNGKRIATLSTQNEIDNFVSKYSNNVYRYTWKAAYYTGPSVDNVLNLIKDNKIVTSDATSYFTDYKPVKKQLTHK